MHIDFTYRTIQDRNMTSSSKIPYGLRALRILAVIYVVLYAVVYYGIKLLVAVLPSMSSLFGGSTLIFMLLPVLLSVVTIITINTRNNVLYKVTLLLFLLAIVVNLLPLTHFSLDNGILILLTEAPHIFFAWYLVTLKSYFTDRSVTSGDPGIKKADKAAKIFLIIWIVVTLGLSVHSVITSRISSIAQRTAGAKYLQAFNGKSYKEKVGYCESLVNEDKDLCLYLAFYDTKNKDNITLDSCNLLAKQEYRLVCYGMINRCDVLTDQKLKDACTFTAQQMMTPAPN